MKKALMVALTLAVVPWSAAADSVSKDKAWKHCTAEADAAMDETNSVISFVRIAGGDPIYYGTLMVCMGKLGFHPTEFVSDECSLPGPAGQQQCWYPNCPCKKGDAKCNPLEGYLVCEDIPSSE